MYIEFRRLGYAPKVIGLDDVCATWHFVASERTPEVAGVDVVTLTFRNPAHREASIQVERAEKGLQAPHRTAVLTLEEARALALKIVADLRS